MNSVEYFKNQNLVIEIENGNCTEFDYVKEAKNIIDRLYEYTMGNVDARCVTPYVIFTVSIANGISKSKYIPVLDKEFDRCELFDLYRNTTKKLKKVLKNCIKGKDQFLVYRETIYILKGVCPDSLLLTDYDGNCYKIYLADVLRKEIKFSKNIVKSYMEGNVNNINHLELKASDLKIVDGGNGLEDFLKNFRC